MGCREAKRLSSSKGNSAVVVLAFGRPIKGGKWQWAASLFGRGYRSTDQIQEAVQAYGEGYVSCSPDGPRLTVAIGTSNGDAAGCPPRGDCAGVWTPEDVWFVSWGARTAWPLPQIYTLSGSMAQQWYHLSLYSYQHHGWRMTIAGALSQRMACRQYSDPCRGMDNSPAKACGQLNRLLNRDGRTAQRLPWSSDFSWGS